MVLRHQKPLRIRSKSSTPKNDQLASYWRAVLFFDLQHWCRVIAAITTIWNANVEDSSWRISIKQAFCNDEAFRAKSQLMHTYAAWNWLSTICDFDSYNQTGILIDAALSFQLLMERKVAAFPLARAQMGGFVTQLPKDPLWGGSFRTQHLHNKKSFLRPCSRALYADIYTVNIA